MIALGRICKKKAQAYILLQWWSTHECCGCMCLAVILLSPLTDSILHLNSLAIYGLKSALLRALLLSARQYSTA